MNNVDYGNKINRQREIYQKNLSDNRRNHNEEVENLKISHNYKQDKQTDVHGREIRKLEDSHIATSDRVRDDQKKSLMVKSDLYEKSLNKNKNEFHEQKKDNIRNWNKKFTELTDSFGKNLADTKDNDTKIRGQLEKNYRGNIESVRKNAGKDLEAYIENNNRGKKESDIQFRIEKNEIIAGNDKERQELLAQELEKKNFITRNAVKDTQDGRNLQENRFLASRDNQEQKFKQLTADLDNRVDSEITKRETLQTEKHVAENKKNNVAFSEKTDELSRKFEKDVRNLEYRKRAENISEGDLSKKIQEKYKDNQRTQIDLQKETQMRERSDVEKKYSIRLRDTVESYQNNIREQNIENAEKVTVIEANLTGVNRQDKYDDRKARERIGHDHQVALKYVNEKSALSEADSENSANRKVRSLKENFHKSMEAARVQSQQSSAITRQSMLDDKRVLEERLHAQNSNQNSQIKKEYVEKIDKLSEGYEKRIQNLELQNKLIQANSNDNLRDLMRKSTFEIDRQKKAAKESALTEIKTEKGLSRKRESALNEKIKNLETNFTQKMNDQTMMSSQKIKDIQFQNKQNLSSEANRYKDIIDQNNKFTSREFQRLKIASETEKQQLITQYEDKIAQLQRVYRDKTSEIKQFNELNKA